MADAMERHTPVIILTHEERQRLREAWEHTKDTLSLVALQNDDELRHLQNVGPAVLRVEEMIDREREEREGWIGAVKRVVLAIVYEKGWAEKPGKGLH